MGNNENEFGKTICTICYEDLKPLIEDLQAISICGHVFHELCLQQWLEYCDGKKQTCPVCKQKCCQQNIGRLYFQSVGDPADLIQKKGSKIRFEEEDPRVLRAEVKKLEDKILGITESLERKEKELKDTNEQLCVSKAETKREMGLKNEALKEREVYRTMLRTTSEELSKAESECARLQQRSLGLAKEVAALKLVSDVNLEEEEVLKLASFSTGNSNKDTIDVLKKSLVLRNKSYKELMVQCNLLGRGETRSHKKLEKTKEKMNKLKSRVLELELALEQKENEVLRALKASKRTPPEEVDLSSAKRTSREEVDLSSAKRISREEVDLNSAKRTSFSSFNKCSFDEKIEQSAEPLLKSDEIGAADFFKESGVNSKKDTDIVDIDPELGFSTIQNSAELAPAFPATLSAFLKPQMKASKTLEESRFSSLKSAIDTKKRDPVQGQSSVFLSSAVDVMDEDVVQCGQRSSDPEVVILDEVTEDPLLRRVRNEASCSAPTSSVGDQCFSGGLVGPDGTNRYLGKWCKRTQLGTSVPSSNASLGSLISVGADGRGGRIKVLRSQNQSETVVTPAFPKRSKIGGKQSGQQAQGCLQIEHFFRKANRS
ncbi:hypothetical protein C5167_026035 [Papaver somniferum]|uniref:E3 ubiquitin-protein ligase TRAIP-like n=1 Tax=Papaver somniferum TaxID=3469 RepID=UPI000E6FB47D|nr:E3 ubiquitin-protein ligase TRAIP-like [Papaver somniferum]RZC93426.1 hypothetical protein C5167_026035 [Papaver somniferum]